MRRWPVVSVESAKRIIMSPIVPDWQILVPVHISGLRSSDLLATDILQLLVTRLDKRQHLVGTWNTWTNDSRFKSCRCEEGGRGQQHSRLFPRQGYPVVDWCLICFIQCKWPRTFGFNHWRTITIHSGPKPGVILWPKHITQIRRGCPAMSDNGKVLSWK